VVRKAVWWLVWPILGGLVVGWWINYRNISMRHELVILELQQFKQKGRRFTADDGRSHCLDIQELQRQAGLPVRECNLEE
jgi:hypothetical protein